MATLSSRIRAFFNGDLARDVYEVVALMFAQQDSIAWPVPRVLTGNITLTDEDNGSVFLVQAAAVITFPAALSRGFSVVMIRDTASTVNLSTAGSFLGPAGLTLPAELGAQGTATTALKVDDTRIHLSGAASQ